MSRWQDVSYPLGSTLTKFVEDKGTQSVLETSIVNILLTRKGEMPWNPEFGSDFLNMVFEPADTITESDLRRICSRDVATWDDRVELLSLTFAKPDPDILNVEVVYRATKKNIDEESTFEFSTNSSGELL